MDDVFQVAARAIHARFEERAAQRGNLLGGTTVLGGKTLEDCSPSMKRDFVKDAEAVVAALHEAGYLKEGLFRR